MKSILVDSGYLVALGIARDPRHAAAKKFLAGYTGRLIVPGPVVVETSYFLSTAAKIRLLDWLAKGNHKVVELPAGAYPEIAKILARYAQLDPDFTDAAIVWLADHTGCRTVLTVDKRDFGVYRTPAGKRISVVEWSD